ncbi:MAG: alpha/beta hydrolase-fold protein [Pirellulales bacterium]
MQSLIRCVVLLPLFACFLPRLPAAEWHVSHRGDDAWSGTLAEPDAGRTDGPFATLERARDAIRKLRKIGLAEPVTVFIHGGDYPLERTFQLTKEDSGTAEAPVVWRAHGSEKPVLIGGKAVTSWQPASDDARTAGKLLRADLATQGLASANFSQLIFGSRRQHLARWPNFDPENPYGGGWATVDGKVVSMYADIQGEDKHTLVYKPEDARTWARPTDGEVFVFPRYNWWNNIVRIKELDPATRRITLVADCSYSVRPGDRYFVRGLREELDAPGEWFHDRETNTLFFLPPEPLGGRPVYVPTLSTILSIGPDTSHVTIRGLTFECCEGTAVSVGNARHCRVAGCTVRNVGNYNGAGISVGGSDNTVTGCDVSHTGSSGIEISGGDRKTLTPARNRAENNYIHHTGVFYKQGVGISLAGVGNRLAHNLIHDCPRMGIMFSGNNLEIELNHIRHVNLETEDTGAVYTGGRDWISSRGSVIRWNYFHDILGFGREGEKWVSPHFAWGVYLDDNAGGVDVIGNIVARCSRAGLHLHNGRDNHIENNIFVDCGPQQIEYSGWTAAHTFWKKHFDTMVKGYESVASEPAWQAMRNMKTHPKDAVLQDDLIMSGNEFLRNIVDYRDPKAKLFAFRNLPLDHYQSNDNVVWHHGLPLRMGQMTTGKKVAAIPIPNISFKTGTSGGPPVDGVSPEKVEIPDEWTAWQALGFDSRSVVADPLFVDRDHDDYRLRPGSPALKLGFALIPVEKIGPFADELRASWPIVEAEGAREKPLTSPSACLGGVEPQRPRGRFEQGVFETSTTYPGTRREWSVYVPAEYTGAEPARLMVFQDGLAYAKDDGPYRVPLVFDELIAKGEMPVTIAVFVTPGTIPAGRPGAKDRSNRSLEYDTLGERYVTFLVDELLPVALDGLKVSADPRHRAICGQSSGGICAFTAAWERPDQFGRVMSHIGSFTDIRGGYTYPVLVRKSKQTPQSIKVYLQDGRDDLDNLFGNWPLANAELAAALAFAGYDHRFELTEGGHSGKAAGAIFAAGLRWLWSDSPPLPTTPAGPETPEKWEPHPLAVARDDVPKGRIERMPPLESQVFPGTVREWAIYVPAQARSDVPAALMVFQDGHDYLKADGRWRVPIVFDNLIAANAMPPTVAVFIDPGHDPAKEKPQSPWKNSNRSLEYDSLGNRYARFLLEEILPEVAKQQPLTSDPRLRAICGASSGGICAFTVAWERPDAFGRVLSTIGSFTGLRGGNAYPSLVRKTEPKLIRVYLADTSGDLDNPFGSWPLANKQLAAALEFMGYDTRFDWAEGYAHDSFHASRIFPDALTWLWRDEQHIPPPATRPDLPGDMSLRRLLIPGAGWEVVADGLGFADAPCTDSTGNFYFCDMKAPAVYRIAATDGTRTTVAAEAVSGLEFGPDGLLYGCQGVKKRLITIDPADGTVREVATDLAPNDLAIMPDGMIFVTETDKQQVTRIDPRSGAKVAADTGITGPNGITLSNDAGTLAVSDYKGGYTWMFRVLADGTLDAKMPTMEMRRPIDSKGEFRFHEPPPLLVASGGDGMAVDRAGRWYVTSALGVQVFDPTGRLCGVIGKPRPDKPLTSCVLAGPDHSELYVTNGNAVYRRKLTVDAP